MGLPAPSKWRILVAVVFVLSCFAFTLFVWRSFGGPTPFGAKGYRVAIPFEKDEGSQLFTNAGVRISGVEVGSVVAVERSRTGSVATVELDSKYAPLASDARAMVRFKTLLGETFIALTPGSQSARKIPDGGRLRRDGVRQLQQVDRVLGTFDERTRNSFARFLTATSDALDGRADDVNAAIGHLGPTATNLATALRLLDQDRAALRGLVGDGGSALTTIGAESESLRALIRSGRTLFNATAARETALGETVDALPGFLADVRATTRALKATARDARPTLAALKPVVPRLSPALVETDRLAPELRRTFQALDPVIETSGPGLRALDRLLAEVKPTIPVLRKATGQLVPLADYLRLYRRDVIAWAAKVGAATNARLPNEPRDSADRALRILPPLTEEALVGYNRRLGSNRYNPYPAPGALEELSSGLEAFDCRNTGNPQTVPVLGAGPPPCKLQPQIDFRGKKRQFPHVAPEDG